jgi:CheY-like chemotaxis protein
MAIMAWTRADIRERAILYVEDDADTREAVEAVLVDEGYRVKTAASLADGLRAIAEGRFDLVLTDYNLPDGTGAMLVKRARASGALGGTPALLVTAMPDAHSIGDVHVVKKPLTPSELLTIVRVAMGVAT